MYSDSMARLLSAQVLRDLYVFCFDGATAPSIGDFNEASLRPMGSTQNVRQKISACLQGVDWSDPSWGIYEGDGFCFEFLVWKDKAEIKEFLVTVRGDGDAAGALPGEVVSALLKFTISNGWSLLDRSTNEFIDPANPSNEHWEGLHAFHDNATGADASQNMVVHQKPKKRWWKLW